MSTGHCHTDTVFYAWNPFATYKFDKGVENWLMRNVLIVIGFFFGVETQLWSHKPPKDIPSWVGWVATRGGEQAIHKLFIHSRTNDIRCFFGAAICECGCRFLPKRMLEDEDNAKKASHVRGKYIYDVMMNRTLINLYGDHSRWAYRWHETPTDAA